MLGTNGFDLTQIQMTNKQQDFTTTQKRLQAQILKRVAKYEKLNLFEKYALYMGNAQLLELSLKNLLINKFNYTIEQLEKKTLGQTAKELKAKNIRTDFVILLDNVVDDRNYIAHDFLANEFITIQFLVKSKIKGRFTKQNRILQKAIFELEQIIVFYIWVDKNNTWT